MTRRRVKRRRGRRQGASGGDLHRGPPDGPVATAGRDRRRGQYTVPHRKRLRKYSRGVGKFQIITDVYGGFSYTEDLSQFLEKVLSLLDVEGSFFTMVQSVHFEAGKDSPTKGYLTELVDQAAEA